MLGKVTLHFEELLLLLRFVFLYLVKSTLWSVNMSSFSLYKVVHHSAQGSWRHVAVVLRSLVGNLSDSGNTVEVNDAGPPPWKLFKHTIKQLRKESFGQDVTFTFAPSELFGFIISYYNTWSKYVRKQRCFANHQAWWPSARVTSWAFSSR